MSLDRVAVAMAPALDAARAVFVDHGVDPDALIINVAWTIDDVQWVAGSRVPDDAPAELADSLRASASEVLAAEGGET